MLEVDESFDRIHFLGIRTEDVAQYAHKRRKECLAAVRVSQFYHAVIFHLHEADWVRQFDE
jgi:hypothetical protein